MNEPTRPRPGWGQPPPPDFPRGESEPIQRGTRYRRPSESNYAKGSWWAGHGAELVGAVAGFIIGFIVLLIVGAFAPQAEVGWIPLVTLVAGALGLRYVVGRQLRR